MKIINTISDLRVLDQENQLPKKLVTAIEKKLQDLQNALEPEVELNDFSLAQYGSLVFLEMGDEGKLDPLWLCGSLMESMPEWIAQLSIDDDIYYVVNIMRDNDFIYQFIVSPEMVKVNKELALWLANQEPEVEDWTL